MTKVQNSKLLSGKTRVILLAAVLLILFLITISYFTSIQKLEDKKVSKICFKENCFRVKIVDTPEERMAGLMGKKRLDPDSGMLFVFEKEDGYGFWMKNTLISLDIIWIDAEGKIVFIKNNALPCRTKSCETFYPDKKAKYVLEINGGLAEKIGLKRGDVLEFGRYVLKLGCERSKSGFKAQKTYHSAGSIVLRLRGCGALIQGLHLCSKVPRRELWSQR